MQDFAKQFINTEAFPLDDLDTPRAQLLIEQLRADLLATGTCSLNGFLEPTALNKCIKQILPLMEQHSFHHHQQHNIYFKKAAAGDDQNHLLTQNLRTSNHTLTSDQLDNTIIHHIYLWPPLRQFLARLLDKPALYLMDDPLAQLNVMGYGEGDCIGWHFDRAEFTVTLLLQQADIGGVFEYSQNLRSATHPNYSGIDQLLRGDTANTQQIALKPGTLNVFIGRYSAHRVTAVQGSRKRLIAVLSYMEQPGAAFSAEDRQQFYGRARPLPSTR